MLLPDLLDENGKRVLFSKLCERAMTERREQGRDGIGTLSEKWLHRIVKRYLTEDTQNHEIPVEGRKFVSDVRIGDHAYEVQTGDFAPMAEKLDYCLNTLGLEVTVVYPVAQNRWVSRIHPETAEISPRRRSPRHGKPADLLARLYPIRRLLSHPRLHFRVLALEVHDFRLESDKGRRGKSPRFERIPLALLSDQTFEDASALARLLPETLPECFTVKELSKATGLRGRDPYSAARALEAAGLLCAAEPLGRAMRFRRRDLHGSNLKRLTFS
ncbi:MAG: hypothetical protein E7620_03935 [Ruminococcaceae bacterium]|nr:hypothetical protein [Oscillospiraceae bacterium]